MEEIQANLAVTMANVIIQITYKPFPVWHTKLSFSIPSCPRIVSMWLLSKTYLSQSIVLNRRGQVANGSLPQTREIPFERLLHTATASWNSNGNAKDVSTHWLSCCFAHDDCNDRDAATSQPDHSENTPWRSLSSHRPKNSLIFLFAR